VPVSARAEPSQAGEVASLERGLELYGLHCAVCHGKTGDGRGEAAYLLSPVPRDFGSGRFRLVSTENAVPSDDDLVLVLRRGMPGSAMPAWEWLSDAELYSLALAVRQLARENMTNGLLADARAEGEDMAEEEAREIATKKLTPRASIDVGTAPSVTDVLLARGKSLYETSCTQCHGADGRARDVDKQTNEDGTPTRPRDFTAGIFKGGSDAADIVRRLRCGLPGCPMPQTQLDSSADGWALAAYVRSFVRPGAQERVQQRRGRISVARSAGRVPSDPEAREWQAVQPVWLALMPLWWHDERIEGVELRALHDGERLALHLTWADARRDDDLLGTNAFTDGAAVQLSAGPVPPLFTMGEAGRPVNLWNWKAAWERDLVEPRDVRDLYANVPPDMHGFQPPAAAALFVTGRAAGNPMSAERRCCAAEELAAEGFGTLAPLAAAPDAGGLAGQGVWKDGAWRVVFSRPMAARFANQLALAPGGQWNLALAVWDGAAEERNGQKSVTVWQELLIQR
jgi:cytochrome c